MPADVAVAYVEDISRRPTQPAGCQREPQPESMRDRLQARPIRSGGGRQADGPLAAAREELKSVGGAEEVRTPDL